MLMTSHIRAPRRRRIPYAVVILSYLLTHAALQAQVPTDWCGRWWEGMLTEAMLPLNIHIQCDSNGVRPLLYSPLQSPTAMKPTQYSYHGDTLSYADKQLGIKMTLHYRPSDSTLTGTFRQQLLRADIIFTPCDTLSQFRRPQTPRPPYSFESRPIQLRRKDRQGNEVVLSGTLAVPTTPPAGKNGYPAVLLVSGSGQQNRDEEIFLHKPFLVIAEYFAQHGIATLRYDDRGVGESRGPVQSATTYDMADDAEALFKLLRKSSRIDRNNVGIIGHSEGGAIAPMIAARNKKVAFVVLMAGPGCTGADILLQQNEALLRVQGIADSLISIRTSCMRDIFRLMDSISPDNYQNAFTQALQRHTSHLDREQLKAIGMRKSDVYMWAQQMQMPWMRAFIKLDPSSYLPQVRCPLMAINGSKDMQVLADPNMEALRTLLPQNAPKPVLIKYDGLNHLFQPCQRGDVSEYFRIEQTIEPKVLQDMANFILSRYNTSTY